MDINLLPKTTPRPGIQRRRGQVGSTLERKAVYGLALPLAIVLGAGIVLQWWLGRQSTDLQRQAQTLQTEISTEQARGSTGASGSSATTLSQAIRQSAESRIPWDVIAKNISDCLPAGMTVDVMDSTSGPLEVSGRSSGLAAVAAFEGALGGYTWETGVEVQNVQVATGSTPAIFAHVVHGDKMPYTYTLSVTLASSSTGGSTS
jgi:Tfp pilus assembly protein PilN